MLMTGKFRVINLEPSQNKDYPDTRVTVSDVDSGTGQLRFNCPVSMIGDVKMDALIQMKAVEFQCRISQKIGMIMTLASGKLEVIK